MALILSRLLCVVQVLGLFLCVDVRLGAQNGVKVHSLLFPGGGDFALDLMKRYGWAVTYEEPLYVREDKIPDYTFEYEYSIENGKPQEEPLVFLRRLASECASRGGPTFLIRERQGRFGKQWNVIAVGWRTASGILADQTALLDTVIDIRGRKDTLEHFLNEAFEQIGRASGHHVTLGHAPANVFRGVRPFSFMLNIE